MILELCKKILCRLGHHDFSIQGPECGVVCSQCEDYPEGDDPLAEVRLCRRIGLWVDTGPDYDHPACDSCLARVARRAVREGRASPI